MISIKVPSEFMMPVTVKSYGAGAYLDGIWIDGSDTIREVKGSLHPPTEADYRKLPEGNSGKITWIVYANIDFTLGIDGSVKPDEILVDGIWFKMISKNPWVKNGYSSGTFVEVKP